jgi:enoyl-CoA hydratase/carnithine racemase
MTDSLVAFTTQDSIATITLNRPDKRNAMSDDMRTAFIHALESVSADKAIKALVLTGAGKGFCAGGDIEGMKRRLASPAGDVAYNGWHRQQRVHHAQSLLMNMPKPVIAAVNGAASGLGADTAMACDFVMCSEFASFTWSYIQRGIIPDGGGMYFLPRRTGLSKAKELIFTGRTVKADEAVRLGIADRQTSSETLVADAQSWAKELSSASSTALALAKSIVNESFESSAHHVFAQGSLAQGMCYTSTQHRDAVEAFLAKAAQK